MTRPSHTSKGGSIGGTPAAPWGSGFPRPGEIGTQLDMQGVPPWNIHVFKAKPEGGLCAMLLSNNFQGSRVIG